VTEAPPELLDPARTLHGVLGIERLELTEEHVTGRAEVKDALKQPMGLVHGGVYAAMAEGLCSEATFVAVFPDGNIATGMSNSTSFLRPITAGTIHAEGRRRHRGRTTWVWDVDFTDDEGRLCAVTRVTMAVRAAPGR
jgi:1,4-dihydroxy-2-naphthoyl-CoA hydrolase